MQERLCGIDGSFQVRTLLDKPKPDLSDLNQHQDCCQVGRKDQEELYRRSFFFLIIAGA